jgi:hypothetical protein
MQCQAERAAQCVRDGAGATACAVTDTAGAAADSAQLQEHRAAGTVQQVRTNGRYISLSKPQSECVTAWRGVTGRAC